MKKATRTKSIPTALFRTMHQSSEGTRMRPKKSKMEERLLKLRAVAEARPGGGSDDETALAIQLYKILLLLDDDKDEQKAFLAWKFWDQERTKAKLDDGKLDHHIVKFVYGRDREQARKVSEVATALRRAFDQEHTAERFQRALTKAGSVRHYSRRSTTSSKTVRVSESLREKVRKLTRTGADISTIVVRVAHTKKGITLHCGNALVTESTLRADKERR